MERVNLNKDERVFVLLDEGCNRTCHTPDFEDHLGAVLKKRGEKLGELSGGKRSYEGI